MTDQLSSRGRKPQRTIFKGWYFLCNDNAISKIPSTISSDESGWILFVPNKITKYWKRDGGKLLLCHRTFYTLSPPIPQLMAFNESKYLLKILCQRDRQVIKESPINKVE